MLGNTILCNAGAKGRQLEGTIGQAGMYPGIRVQVQAAVPLTGGRPTYIPYSPGANNDPAGVFILLDDPFQGCMPGTVYQNGTRCFVYAPLAGDEMNVMVDAMAGTGSANAFFIGDRLQAVNGTGRYIKGVAPTAPADFVVMEHIDTTVDTPTLVYAQKQ